MVKDCYDTYEKVRARLKYQTEKGQQYAVENGGSSDEQESMFVDSNKIENVMLQVGAEELKTLGGHTSRYMLLD